MTLVGRFDFGSKKKTQRWLRLFYFNYLVLAVAAITTTAASAATTWTPIAAATATRAASTTGTASTMPSATSAAAAISAAGRTVSTRTIRTIWPACCYGFTVGVFAVKVRLDAAFFVSEVTAALKRDSLFAFSAWLSRRTLTALTAFSARTLTRLPAFAARTLA